MNWTYVMLILSGIISEKIAQWIRKTLAMPYRWTCPKMDCKFSFSSSDHEAYAIIKGSHEDRHELVT